MSKCDHERLSAIGITSNNLYLQCNICTKVISLKEILEENQKLKELNKKYSNENLEIRKWINEIENKNDALQRENESLKMCLKNLI